MATEVAIFRVQLDASEFNAGVAGMRNNAEAAAAKVTTGSAAVGQLGKAMAATKGTIAEVAAGMAGLDGNTSMVIGTVASFAKILSPGGVFVGAVMAGVGALGAIISHVRTTREESQKAARAFSDAWAGNTGSVKSSIEETRAALANYGKTATEIAIADAKRAQAMNESAFQTQFIALKTLESQRQQIAARQVSWWDTEGKIAKVEELKIQDELITRSKTIVKETGDMIPLNRENLKLLEELAAKEREREKSTKKIREDTEAQFGSRKTGFGSVDEQVAARFRMQGSVGVDPRDEAMLDREQANMIAAEQQADAEKWAALREKVAKETAERVTEVEKAASQKRMEQQENEAKAFRKREEEKQAALEEFVDVSAKLFERYAQLAQSAISQTFDVFLDVIEQMVAQQEINWMAMAAAFLKSMGKQIFGIGLGGVFEGGMMVLRGIGTNDGKAVGIGMSMMALGTQAMAVGGAMAVSGAVVGGINARSSGGGGGSSGGGGTGRSRGDRGDRGGGGDDTMHTTYVFNGGTIMGDPTSLSLSLDRNRRRMSKELYAPRGS